jgi:hypothetical protein
MRTIFAIFFLYSLLNSIRQYSNQNGNVKSFLPLICFWGYLAGNIIGYSPFPYFLISLGSFIFLIAPFKALNFGKINDKKLTAKFQVGFTNGQAILLGLGGLYWCLLIVSLALNESLFY